MLTTMHRKRLMELAGRAWRAEGSQVNFDQWRREQCLEACGKASTKEMNSGAHYDKCMLHFAVLASDDALACHFAVAEERRLRWVIEKKLAELGKLEGTEYTFSYVRALCVHLKLPLRLEECPAELALKVLQALNTQVRRVKAARGLLTPRGQVKLGERRRIKEQQRLAAGVAT